MVRCELTRTIDWQLPRLGEPMSDAGRVCTRHFLHGALNWFATERLLQPCWTSTGPWPDISKRLRMAANRSQIAVPSQAAVISDEKMSTIEPKLSLACERRSHAMNGMA